MNTFLDCITGKEGVLFLGPLVVLFVVEVSLCIIYVKECRRLGLFQFRTRNGRREEVFEV